ncbi:MAG: SDR family NAD(P)-dependent oxidoreductase [Candidatus Promineifilaceae bacterium]
MNQKRVIVTGAGRGIGRNLAEGFAAAGATVVLGSRSSAEITQVAENINTSGGRAHAFTLDVTDSNSVTHFIKQATTAMGGVDVLINNAGAAKSHKFATHPDDLWHQMLAVNLTGVYHVTKAVVPTMLAQQSGRIINIASIASKVGGKYVSAYTASKHGVLGLTRALALELAPNLTVNAICPGYVNTPMTDATVDNIVSRTGMSCDEARAMLAKDSPQKRLTEPDEITALALYLASDAASGINGQAINVDGGTVMF